MIFITLTKNGLITELDGIYAIVCAPTLVRTDAFDGKTKATYQVNVMKVTGNLARFFSIIFYVLDEGQAGEIAYYDLDRAPAELQTPV